MEIDELDALSPDDLGDLVLDNIDQFFDEVLKLPGLFLQNGSITIS